MIASSTPTGDGRWPIALRAATSTAIPVAVGWAAGNVGSGLIATLGAFTSRFGSGRPYLNRGVQLAVVAVALAAAVSVGSWAAQVIWFGVAVVSAVAVASVWLCNALAVGPPGAYVFVLACAAGQGVSAAHLEPWQVGALVLAGGAVAWLAQMASALGGPRRPERSAVTAAGAAVADYIEAVGSPREQAARHRAATALHRSWNVLINFQPVDRPTDDTLRDLRAANHALHVLFADSMSTAGSGSTPAPDGADTARGIASLQLAPETVSARDPDRIPLGRPSAVILLSRALRPGSHVRHVMVRVGIAAPLAGAAATLLGIGHAYWAIAAAVLVLHQGADRSRTLRRGAERLVGTWVGLALAGGIMWLHPQGLWLALILAVLQFVIEMLVVTSRFQESTRLVESIADAVDAVAVTSAHLAAPDTATLPARAARRDLQLAAVTMRDAADAAEAGSVQQRATALRLAPVVTATEHLAYRTIAACWAMENHTSDPLLGADDAEAYRAQLHRLATALRQGATPPEIRDAPAFLTADATALSEAARQDTG